MQNNNGELHCPEGGTPPYGEDDEILRPAVAGRLTSGTARRAPTETASTLSG